MEFLRKHVEDAAEGIPEYWYGVVEGFGGTLWETLFYSETAAKECAKTLEGTVVIVSTRVVENADGDPWPLPHRTKAMELAESRQNLEGSRKRFEEALGRPVPDETLKP